MKIIPVSYKKQIWAKITVGLILSLISALLIITIFTVVSMPPVWFVVLSIAVIPGAILFPNVTGIIFDLYMPKIKWDNEQKAVKQNMNIVYGIVLSTLMVGLIAIPIAALQTPFFLSAAIIILFPILCTAISAYFIDRKTVQLMLQLNA